MHRRMGTAAAAQAAAGNQGEPPIVIAGAGVAGLATALALHRAGLTPLVLERAPALREEGSAIALWANAWRALDALGGNAGPGLGFTHSVASGWVGMQFQGWPMGASRSKVMAFASWQHDSIYMVQVMHLVSMAPHK